MSLVSDPELEEGLRASAKSLRQPPSSRDELLTLLDRVEELLLKVAQSPPISLQTALSPLTKALVSEKLMKQSDIDVQVAVAACISEITRITAPDAPYDDDKMKDVFQLIVSTFENFTDKSSRSFQKRATILETVAKVRSCVIMLDLELDQMIIEMFQHFLKSIRVYHGELIFTSMETIMTLVLEESEDISPDLLTPILDALKKNNEEVLPIAKKLAEKVFQNGADKLRPCLEKMLNTSSLDDYSEVVASMCQKNTNSCGHSDENILQDQPATKGVKELIKPRDRDRSADVKEEIKPQKKEPALNGSTKPFACNSNNETGDEETVAAENVLNKGKFKQQFDAKATSETESDDMDAQKPELEAEVEHVANGEAKPFNCRNDSAESSDLRDDKKQLAQVPCHQETPSEEIHTSPGESPPVEVDKPSNTVKDINDQLSPVKEVEVEGVKVAPPIKRGSVSDENQPKSSGRTKRKENMVNQDAASTKTSKGTNITEVNKKQRTKKKQHSVTTNKDKALSEGVSKNDAGTLSDSEAKDLDSEKLADVSNKKDDGSLQNGAGRRGGRVKSKSEKDTSKHSITKDTEKDPEASLLSSEKSAEDEVSQEETPRTGSKRKQTPGTDNKPLQYGKNLVGSKVKVWWPDDEAFYEGVIASFNPVNRRHKVSYDDGDTEVLNLRKELWEFVRDDSALHGGQSAEHPGKDASSNKKMKKGPAISETSNKREKDDPPKRKPKANASKSGSKSKNDSKPEPEPTEISEDETDKSEDHSEELPEESPERSTKASGKSQDIGVAKSSSKKKQDTQRSTNSKGKTPPSKGKTPQTGKNVTLVGKGVKKPSLSKAKSTMDSEKSSDTVKGAKSGGSGNKSGKRKRK